MKELKQPTKLCLLCNQPMSESQGFLSDLFSEDPICFACRKKLTSINRKIKLKSLQVHGLYLYDESFSSWIIQYKECCDEILGPYFLTPFLYELKLKYKNCVIIPAPSSKEKMEERGFHAVIEIFKSLSLEIEDCFIKTKEVKQSKRSKWERQKIEEAIQLVKVPKRKKVILIDDVCTTGNTLLTMHHLLKEKGIKSKALVLAIHPLLVSKSDSIRQVEKFILTKK